MNPSTARQRSCIAAVVAGLAIALAGVGGATRVTEARAGAPSQSKQDDTATYRPKLAVPEALQPFLKDLEPGSDAFPAEQQAKELEARLRELGDSLRARPARAARVADWLLDPAFRGGRLLPSKRPRRRTARRST